MVESILEFIKQNSELAWLVIFVVAFLESMAIVGLLIPGWVLLVGVGTLIGADALSFYPIVISAYLGAVIGEYISFYFGYHYHEKILSWQFVAKHKKLIRLCRRFFHKHGVGGVFVGRFFGPTRAVIPLVAGISEMNKMTFFWVNITSGIFWAPLYLLPGILVGAAFSLDKQEAYHLLLILGLVALAFGMAFRYSKSYWKTVYHGKKQNSALSISKVVLWWAIALACLSVFLNSPYLDLLNQIALIFFERL